MNAGQEKVKHKRPAAVAVGMFDGVHLGHRDLLRRLVNEAAERGYEPVALTFDSHPASVLRPDAVPPSLATLDERVRLLKEAGVGRVEVMRFTAELAALPAAEFLAEMKRRINLQMLVPGFNTSMGSDRLKGADAFARVCGSLGIDMVQASEFRLPGEESRVCSSEIRRLLAEGNVKGASRMLGRNYAVAGSVVAGNRVGRGIGFPTANISPADENAALPACGVYAARVNVENEGEFGAMVNIGMRPTLDDSRGLVMETHLFDFKGNIYGRDVRVEFVERLRDEQKFASLESLRRQLEADRAEATNLLRR